MDMSNIINETGYVTKHDMLIRMHYLSPDDAGRFVFEKKKNSSFSHVLSVDDNSSEEVFSIYTGTKDLYLLLSEWAKESAGRLSKKIVVKAWRENAK